MLDAEKVRTNLNNLFFVGSADDHGSVAVTQQFLKCHDLASAFRGSGQHDIERFIEDDLGSTL
jgi:hypothetical protein